MSAQTKNQYAMQDPTKQYPQPKFEDQPQSAPGLARDMVPKPDHGEESYRGFGRLEGRRAVITGADSGIGRAVAIAFAREGADLVLNYLASEEADAKEVVGLVQAAGRKAVAMPGDLSDEAFCVKLIEQGRAALGGIDILVNVAGKQTAVKDIADITTEQFDQTFRTNVYSMFWLCKAALPHMPPGATIINTTSIQSYQPSQTLAGLRLHQGGDHRLHPRAGEAGCLQGHPRQRGGARPGVDAAAVERRPAAGEDPGFRRPGAARPSGPAGGAGAGLRVAGVSGIELRDRRGVRRDGRQPPALNTPL